MTDDQIERVARAICAVALVHDNAWDCALEKTREKYRDQARAAIAAASEWLPIESAPKDGTSVLVWDDGFVKVGYWDGAAWFDEQNTRLRLAPTHWQPLPLPPCLTASAS
jgi:hypothetical protein